MTVPSYLEASHCSVMGKVALELGKNDAAEKLLVRALTLAEGIDNSFLLFNIHLARAELCFARGDNNAGIIALKMSMTIGKQNNYYNSDCWCPYVMCLLCIKALENDIEVDYVQKLVKKRKFEPDRPPLHINNWPWRVKIFTLGRFGLLVDGKPVKINSNGLSKPIMLLKVLVTMGGRDVSEIRICEALWPDSEGDNAHSAYTTTLSRLRKILVKDALHVNNGQLSLNDHLCWLDLWAFKSSLKDLERALTGVNSYQIDNIEKNIIKVFSHYQGLFMEYEVQAGWMLPQRERLQVKLLRIIKQAIKFFSSNRRCKKVIELYEKALEIDPLSEDYYRGLMQCHAGLGNLAKALVLYDHCQSILGATFGIKPSQKTKKLHEMIEKGYLERINLRCELCSRANH